MIIAASGTAALIGLTLIMILGGLILLAVFG